ncbi:MAG: NAD(P)H-dependent oxidoreductase subunit E [Acidimicrobiia bacterium]|nr:NAD(P)H-dependent oxidoreductase subunit E [Acidimicrobiia bacterium]
MTDVHIGTDRPTPAEAAAVDGVVDATIGPVVVRRSERLVLGGSARRNERRHLLLPALHALQRTAGWISPGGINHLADVLGVPPAEAYGVATFYDLFVTEDPGHERDVLHVCVDAACQIAGSAEVIAGLAGGGEIVRESPCLGQCERPVAQFLQGRGKADAVPVDIADGGPPAPLVPQAGDPRLRLLSRVGTVDPTELSAYVNSGGYKALAKAFTLGPDGVIDEIDASGLMGRGGAAFPTAVKWRAVAGEAGTKHVVVNADESEPGTFKDRILMENDPFAVIEAATIAGFATGASNGWIYIRGEYPLATERLAAAIDQAREAGFLGERIARSSFTFDLEIRRGAGAYICGEETALFNSLEGFRGEPRQKPPFPTTNGLFHQPTVINNPETLANVLDIVTGGGAAFASVGTEGSTGTKLFCLSGRVAKPGLYEVPFGATLGELLDLAGGAVGHLRAVLLGGAAGSFVGPDQLDLPLTFEGSRAAGLSLGSGVVMAFDAGDDLTAVVTRIAEFFRHESCGQCVPCRVGTIRQHELLAAGGTGWGNGSNGSSVTPVALLDEMDRAMKDASICGLGHTASTAVRSAIDLGLIEGLNP